MIAEKTLCLSLSRIASAFLEVQEWRFRYNYLQCRFYSIQETMRYYIFLGWLALWVRIVFTNKSSINQVDGEFVVADAAGQV
ncbi:hypothetical protein [Candidatus Magnetaquicoccus inordinatus]|uniref:hypothetical protein n=1 Tax=Candidatus Magnetaquicoccus inordinatus TaxID=2496818 RepID=UPI00187D2C95|nr:hypothetical protein [Candidatus Magnetaquicoccus inordinatus]